MENIKIYRPVRTNILTQGFGENKTCIAINIDGTQKFPMQLKGSMNGICDVGYTSVYRIYGLKGHNGLDLATYDGEPLYFSVDANVEWYAMNYVDESGGIGVDVISRQPINGEYLMFRFWHLKNSVVKNGEKVRFGQLIGYCDNTGVSTGSHLHWGKKIVDAEGHTLNKDNGYLGAVPFTYDQMYVLDFLGIVQQQLGIIKTIVETLAIIFRIKKDGE